MSTHFLQLLSRENEMNTKFNEMNTEFNELKANHLKQIQSAIAKTNEFQKTMNRKAVKNMSFNLKKNPGVIPIVAYVFNRPNQLRKLLSSLELVEGINDTILVISHDGSNEEMWKMVEQINFCEVLQITHPSVYFIPETVPAIKLKSHWMWLNNFLWDAVFPDHEGDILFLEEDDVVSPDYFKSSTIMSHLKKTHPGIYSFAMGTDCHTKKLPECLSGAPNEYKMKTIFTTKYFFNRGTGFNRSFWEEIKEFNTLPKYNSIPDWDSMIYQLKLDGLINGQQLVPASGRVVHTSHVGIHGEISASDQPWNHYKNGSLSLNFENEWKWKSIQLIKFKKNLDEEFKKVVICSGWEQCGIPINLLEYHSKVKMSITEWEHYLRLT